MLLLQTLPVKLGWEQCYRKEASYEESVAVFHDFTVPVSPINPDKIIVSLFQTDEKQNENDN